MSTKQDKQAGERKINYAEQCRTFAENSVERCALCLNHPGEHSFPVTTERDELLVLVQWIMKRLLDIPDVTLMLDNIQRDWVPAAVIAKAEGSK